MKAPLLFSWGFGCLQMVSGLQFSNPVGFVGSHVPLPPGGPGSLPGYMRDNINNEYGTAPDMGLFNGPLLGPLSPANQSKIHPGPENATLVPIVNAQGSLTSVVTLPASTSTPLSASATVTSAASQAPSAASDKRNTHRQNSDGSGYWLGTLGSDGLSPLAPSNYTFFRNVKDFGAMGDGSTDDTVAINMAVSDGNRCGNDCGSSTVYAAVVYFPPGTYVVSSPIIQYYYTQFIGDPDTPPTLQSTFNFTGIAMVDSDVYIPGGNGAEWYINQNNFYRSIQNINFDLTQQAPQNTQNYQVYVPTGIHWQVGQGTSITNCNFTMAVSTGAQRATGVGIFMENGSGGFMSDLSFFGGNAGMVVGSQQFTFRNLHFVSCLQAVSVLWNWGMTFQNIYVESCYYAFNSTVHGGATGQGTGTLTVLDSHFNGVPTAIFLPSQDPVPNVVIDNLLVENSAQVVLTTGGKSLLTGSSEQLYIESWALGGAYLDDNGVRQYLTGDVNPPPHKSASLIAGDGRYFTRSKPFYSGESVVVATQNGVANDMTGDQTASINSLLANNVGKVIFFPAGIYLVKGTVHVPEGTMMIGSGFSQIMASGSYFQNQDAPQVMLQVGKSGDQGIVEIQDFLFTVQGPTAGCILVEWNIAQSQQGSAAMWNSNFRVGGAAGSDLQVAQCQDAAPNSSCNAASMLLHLTPGSTGYFENVWAWVADHDLDNPGNALAGESMSGVPINVNTDVNIYAGRGILVESQGPSWFWASASEHSELYNYQFAGASDIFIGCMQTESPYYQPVDNISSFAYPPGTDSNFVSDPSFSDCESSNCLAAWAFRVINSTNIFVYGSGFYAFFNQHQLGCGNEQTCQERLIETNFVGDLFYYSLFTYGATEIISPTANYLPPIFFNDSNQSGYTSEIAVYLELANGNGIDLGVNQTAPGGAEGGNGIVYINPTIYSDPGTPQTIGCEPPCTFVLPPISLSTPTTITIPPWTTTVEVGWTTTTTITTTLSGGSTALITTPYFTAVPEQTVITIPPVTTTLISIWEVTIQANETTNSPVYLTSSVVPPPVVLTDNPNPLSQSGVSHSPVSRTVYPPPWPWITTSSSRDSHLPTLTYHSGKTGPTCHAGCGTQCRFWCSACNPLLSLLTGGCTGSDFCTSDCPPGVGPGNDGTFPPNDPDNPDSDGGDDDGDGDGNGNGDGDDDDDGCTTVTASSCSQYCQGSSCTTTCQTYQGCSVMDTTLASTVTAAPFWNGDIEPWPTMTANSASEAAIEASVESALIASGLVYTAGNTLTGDPFSTIMSAPSTTPATPTTPTSSATSASVSAPTSTAIYAVYIGEYITQVTQGSDTMDVYSWEVYDFVDSNGYNGCDTSSAVYSTAANGGQDLPTSLGPMYLTGLGQCTYSSSSSTTVGSLSCDNSIVVDCETAPGVTTIDVCSQSPPSSWNPSIYCQYEYEVVSAGPVEPQFRILPVKLNSTAITTYLSPTTTVFQTNSTVSASASPI